MLSLTHNSHLRMAQFQLAFWETKKLRFFLGALPPGRRLCLDHSIGIDRSGRATGSLRPICYDFALCNERGKCFGSVQLCYGIYLLFHNLPSYISLIGGGIVFAGVIWANSRSHQPEFMVDIADARRLIRATVKTQ